MALLPPQAVATARTNPAPRPDNTEIRTADSHSLWRHAERRGTKLTEPESAWLRTLVGYSDPTTGR